MSPVSINNDYKQLRVWLETVLKKDANNKLTINGTKSSEVLQKLNEYLNKTESIPNKTEAPELKSESPPTSTVVEVKYLSASCIKTILTEASEVTRHFQDGVQVQDDHQVLHEKFHFSKRDGVG